MFQIFYYVNNDVPEATHALHLLINLNKHVSALLLSLHLLTTLGNSHSTKLYTPEAEI